jgi:hypothetical protein
MLRRAGAVPFGITLVATAEAVIRARPCVRQDRCGCGFAPRTPLILAITGVIFGLVGLALAAGGAWLAALGGSFYYLAAGMAVVLTAVLLVMGRRSALWVYAAVLIGTLVWAVAEVGFDWWPLAARGEHRVALRAYVGPRIGRAMLDADLQPSKTKAR